jgi:hypothetical protein
MKKLIAILVPTLLATTCCVAASPSHVYFGFVFSTPEQTYLYTAQPTIDTSDLIDIQYPESTKEGKASCCVQIKSSILSAPSTAENSVIDLIGGGTIYRYEIKSFSNSQTDSPFIGLSVIHSPRYQVSLESDGKTIGIKNQQEQVKLIGCLSGEGMHLFAKNATKLVGHLYYGFEYEVAPTCDPKLFKRH